MKDAFRNQYRKLEVLLFKNKKVGSATYLFSLKLTNLTKPKLMKKNVIQIYAVDFRKSENNC
jgi:hypothetical protein